MTAMWFPAPVQPVGGYTLDVGDRTILTRSTVLMAPLPGSQLSRSLRALQIYGANTDVGKTIFSTLLCAASRRHRPTDGVWYLKPVSTGAPQDADDRHVAKYTTGADTECLLQFEEPVSPHLATAKPSSDETILRAIQDRIKKYARTGPGTLLLETAGGVHSPTPSGRSQVDLYRSLRLPVLLVADSRLGGISSSISAFESLKMRGYDVEGVLLFRNDYYKNHGYLKQYFAKHGSKTGVFPPPPPKIHNDAAADEEAMRAYYESHSSSDEVLEMLRHLESSHTTRISKLETMSEEAHKCIWYPFTQHQNISPTSITAIDSAHGDFFQTFSPEEGEGDTLLTPTFDGSASWWTQGLGHANPDLTLSAAYAAGRYGHVIFADTIHQPALSLAKLLLDSLQNPRLTRVFYSDNGSTGCEVAVKMALKASRIRYGWGDGQEAGVIGMKGSYHGDTLGVMECSAPCDYNKEVDWYKGRGWWFDFPKVMMREGRWIVEVPQDLERELGGCMEFGSLAEIFDLEKRRRQDSGKRYEKYIRSTLERLIKKDGRRFGAVMIEPVVLGAGGMLFADPLFQSILVSVTRSSAPLFSSPEAPPTTPALENSWTGLPIIFDEVFTGIYRLGRPTASSFLQTHPDISVHAKLLTGGLLPLSVTLASDSIFEAFLGDKKKDALLHGHSYTAHAIGCSVAETSVRSLIELDNSGSWEAAKADWRVEGEEAAAWSSWSRGFITTISNLPSVSGVWALGSVLAIHLRASETGYSSTAAGGFLKKMSDSSGRGWKVHARALGNVVYVMTSQMSCRETVAEMEEVVLRAL